MKEGQQTMPAKVLVVAERCKGCKLCEAACPKNLLKVKQDMLNSKGLPVVCFEDGDNLCTSCGSCALMCPDLALRVFRLKKARPQMLKV